MSFRFLNELQAHSVVSLWPGRLALDHLHMVDGDPGIGKSLILLDVCARVTTGQPFPDGAPGGAPAPVLLVSAEDGAADTIRERLLVAGADAGRVVVWQREPGEPWLHLPSDVSKLDDILTKTSARLVILDPLMAFLDTSVNVMNDPSVRQALTPLADLAKKHHCAIILLRHLNKGRGRALYRGLASIAFNAFCRITWLVGRDPKTPEAFVLAQPKNNLDPPQPSLAYRILSVPKQEEENRGVEKEDNRTGAEERRENTEVNNNQEETTNGLSSCLSSPRSSAPPRFNNSTPPLQKNTVAKVRWEGFSHWTHDDLVAHKRQRPREEAREFLIAFLRGGPRKVRDIGAAARAQAMSNTTVWRAAKDLGIRCHQIATPPAPRLNYWLLPSQKVPLELFDESGRKVEAFMRMHDDKYPPADPLELKELD